MKAKTVKEFMKEYNGIFESISLFNLNKERPIVPLKILITELEISLARDLESGELEDLNDLEPSLNPGALQKYLFKLLNHLETYIYTKNRIDLYNKEAIGLNIALSEHDIETGERPDEESDYKIKEYRGDGYSLTSKTKSSEAYLKNQDQRTINRQNLYRRLFKSYSDAVFQANYRQAAGIV